MAGIIPAQVANLATVQQIAGPFFGSKEFPFLKRETRNNSRCFTNNLNQETVSKKRFAGIIPAADVT